MEQHTHVHGMTFAGEKAMNWRYKLGQFIRAVLLLVMGLTSLGVAVAFVAVVAQTVATWLTS